MAAALTCVLFDLDGTLVDTSGDILTALRAAIAQHRFPAVPDSQLKPVISFGAVAMIAAAVPASVDAATREALLASYLAYYIEHIAVHSRLFAGMAETLQSIEARGLKWGVVTNKRHRFTLGLLEALQLRTRAACIVSGDSAAHSKPHPAPMYMACEQAGVNPRECVYIGDAQHDIVAGRAANMRTIAATYGFLQADDQPEHWGADYLAASPQHLNDWIKAALCP
jgi:phosphoglycolate phosphatase